MPSINLEKIKISGYKSIRSLELELLSLNLLIGANGAGKSNFIGVFRLLNEILERRLQVFSGTVGANNLLYFGNKVTDVITLSLNFGANGYIAELAPTNSDTLIFADEEMWFHDKSRFRTPYTVSLGAGHRETLLYEESASRATTNIADHVIHGMRSWKLYHFHDTSANAKVKQTSDINDNEALRGDASNLAAFLFLLREKYRDNYNVIVKNVRLVAPFFDDFILRPSSLNEDKIRLEWRELGSDNYFDGNMLSDGTLRFICLATLLLQPELPSVILIDEPELGLHPYAINQLAALLRSASNQTQVIVSTQSVPLINQFSPENILIVDREDGQTVINRLQADDLGEWIDEYGLGELWEKNLIGGRPQTWEPRS